jgi:predicted HAD superfamily hydrolase
VAEPTLTAVPDPSHETLAEARRLVTSPAVEVVCTDVFDTLVWRKVTEPVDAFELIGTRLIAAGRLHDSVDAAAFAQLRRFTELRVRERFEDEHEQTEIRLEEIYGALPEWLFADGTREDAMQAELDTEREILLPDLDVAQLLIDAAAAGKAIAAVSDTYLSAEQLAELVEQTGVPFKWIFTSADHRENKSGKLWDIVLAATGADPAAVLHVGDNEQADVEEPAERGIRVVHLERRSERFETMVQAEARFSGTRTRAGDGGLTALRAKLEHRAELTQTPSALQPFWRFGAQVYGPVLTGFAEWVHERTREAGASTAFCLMREGGFLSELVNAGAPAVAEPVQARPLWINRDLCTRAAIGAGTREELLPLFFRRTTPTLREVLRSLGLEPNDLPRFATHADTRMDDPITRELVLEELTTNEPVRERIAARSRVLREKLVAYVERECGTEGPIVVVDLGWGATIQQRLVRALEQAGRPRHVVGLYVVTHEAAADAVRAGCEVRGYVVNLGAPAAVSDLVMRAPEIIEQALMPAHGTQLDWTDDLEPVLEDSAPRSVQDVEAEALRRGVRAFQRELLRYEEAHPRRIAPIDADLLAPILLRAVAAPTAEEARAFGRWMHDEGAGGTGAASIVDGEWADKLRHLAPEQLAELPMRDLYWPYGLARQHDPGVADLAAAAAAGLIGWEATGSPLETGKVTIEPIDGVGTEGSPTYDAVPQRNRHGLSFASASLESGMITALQIRLGEHPALVRVDWISLRLWVQGEREPRVVRLAAPGDFALLEARNLLPVGPSVFLGTNDAPAFVFHADRITPKVIFRADVEIAFAALQVAPTLPDTTQDLTKLVARDAARTLSGRLPGPLRRLLRRLR